MHTHSRKLQMKIWLQGFFIVTFLGVGTALSQAATSQCPSGLVCLSQQAANQAAANARELEATKQKVSVLETALTDKDKSIQELKETNDKNVADLKDAMHKTEIELASTKGQLIGAEAQVTRQTAIIDLLLKYARPKKIGLINLF